MTAAKGSTPFCYVCTIHNKDILIAVLLTQSRRVSAGYISYIFWKIVMKGGIYNNEEKAITTIGTGHGMRKRTSRMQRWRLG